MALTGIFGPSVSFPAVCSASACWNMSWNTAWSAGAHLVPEAIDASLKEADAFLARFFPAWQNLAKTCHSWLLSPQLPALLPENSNILRFQHRFRITPEPEQTREFLVWIFKNRDIPYPNLPENTSLQKAVKKHLLDGGSFVEGRGILR